MTVFILYSQKVKKATVDYFDMKLLAIHEGLIMTWQTSSQHLNSLFKEGAVFTASSVGGENARSLLGLARGLIMHPVAS